MFFFFISIYNYNYGRIQIEIKNTQTRKIIKNFNISNNIRVLTSLELSFLCGNFLSVKPL